MKTIYDLFGKLTGHNVSENLKLFSFELCQAEEKLRQLFTGWTDIAMSLGTTVFNLCLI